MYKIGISGKANSGKDTISNLLEYIICHRLANVNPTNEHVARLAFADPVKDIAKIMFPQIPKEHLFGNSKFRSEIIAGAFKNGAPLTIRQLLMDIGERTKEYDHNIWVNNLIYRYKNFSEQFRAKAVIVTDVRFINEFEGLKKHGFYMVRAKRNNSLNLQHISETEQDGISDNQFDYVLNNNGSFQDLEKEVANIIQNIQ